MYRKQSVALLALAGLVSGASAWSEEIGRTSQPLDSRQARLSESTLGDLIADAARASVNAEIALLQASQLRDTLLPAGGITREALVGSLLFPDQPVVLVEIPGAAVVKALERGLEQLPRRSTSFLQVSGLSVSYQSAAVPGQRVTEVKVAGRVIVPERTYRVAMPDSLAKGATGYYRVFDGLKPKQVGPSLSEVLVKHVRSIASINIVPGQRLKDLSPSPSESGKR